MQARRIVFAYSGVTVQGVDQQAVVIQNDRERRAISNAISNAGHNAALDVVPAQLSKIRSSLSSSSIHFTQVLHISAHGHPGGLYLEAEDEFAAREASAATLGDAIGSSVTIPLVVLAACHSMELGKQLTGAGSIGGGWAQSVVATRGAVEDTVAIQFTSQLYQLLLCGRTVQEAFDSARAVIDSDIFVLLPEFAVHDIVLFMPMPRLVSAAPAFMPDKRTFVATAAIDKYLQYCQDTLSPKSAARGAVLLGTQPGVGSSTVAWQACVHVRDRKVFPGGIYWADCGPKVAEVSRHPLARASSSGDPTADGPMSVWSAAPMALESVPPMMNVQPLAAICECLGLPHGSPIEHVISLLSSCPTSVLLVMDNVWPCHCVLDAVGDCEAGECCSLRVVQQISKVCRNTCVLLTSNKPASTCVGMHAAAASANLTAAYAHPQFGTGGMPRTSCRGTLSGLGIRTIRVDNLEPMAAMNLLRSYIEATRGISAMPSTSEWLWSLEVHGPCDAAIVREDRELYETARQCSRQAVPFPTGWARTPPEHMKAAILHCAVLKGLQYNARAITSFVDRWMESELPLFVLPFEIVTACYHDAVSATSAASRPHWRLTGTTLLAALMENGHVKVDLPHKSAAFADLPSKTPDKTTLPARAPLLAPAVSTTDPTNPGAAVAGVHPAVVHRPPPALEPAGRPPQPARMTFTAPSNLLGLQQSMSRDAAEAWLLPYVSAQPTLGVFILRGSSKPGCLALTYTSQMPAGTMTLKNTLIEPHGSGISLRIGDGLSDSVHIYPSWTAFLQSAGSVALSYIFIPPATLLHKSDYSMMLSAATPQAAPQQVASRPDAVTGQLGYASYPPRVPAATAPPTSPAPAQLVAPAGGIYVADLASAAADGPIGHLAPPTRYQPSFIVPPPDMPGSATAPHSTVLSSAPQQAASPDGGDGPLTSLPPASLYI